MYRLLNILTYFIITLILYPRSTFTDLQKSCFAIWSILVFGINSVIIIFFGIQMPSIFQGLFKRNLIVYQPQQWSKRLGQKCSKCDKNLTHQKSISVCKCYYFCHQECFKQQFEQQIHSQYTDIRCQKCEEDLQVRYDVHFQYGPLVTKQKLCKLIAAFSFLILTVLAIIITLNSQIRMEYCFFILYLQGIILSILLYCLVLAVRDIFHKKIVKIQEVISTKLDIQTSAFKDIEMETNQQITKECLFTTKK